MLLWKNESYNRNYLAIRGCPWSELRRHKPAIHNTMYGSVHHSSLLCNCSQFIALQQQIDDSSQWPGQFGWCQCVLSMWHREKKNAVFNIMDCIKVPLYVIWHAECLLPEGIYPQDRQDFHYLSFPETQLHIWLCIHCLFLCQSKW